MSESPWHARQRSWNWVGFWCAIVFVGLLTSLDVPGPFRSLLGHLVYVAVVSSVCGALAGAYGDRFWFWLIRILRHW
jgi:hypothetical protein